MIVKDVEKNLNLLKEDLGKKVKIHFRGGYRNFRKIGGKRWFLFQ